MVEVYNEGLAVFLYDEANSKTIQEADPSLLSGLGDDDVADLALAQLTGALVAYELLQDDDLAIEIIVGPPLTDKELTKGHWLPVQHAPLTLPSGRLRIEGYNNLHLSPDYDPDEEPGAVVSVGKGDYIVSLYRFDWHAAPDWLGPSEVVVLTNAKNAKPVAKSGPLLLVEAPATPVEQWMGAYRIHKDVFRGLIQFLTDGDLFEVNLNPKAAKDLGLKPGAILHLNVENPKLRLDGVYLGEDLQTARAVRQAVARKKRLCLWEAQWTRDDDPIADHLFFQPIDGNLNVASSDRGQWIPVEMTLSPSGLQNQPNRADSADAKSRAADLRR